MTPEGQKHLDKCFLGRCGKADWTGLPEISASINAGDPGRQEFFTAVLTDLLLSIGKGREAYEKTFAHFLLGGSQAEDIVGGEYRWKHDRVDGLMNGNPFARPSAARALEHP